jgi:hypothetical protein
MEGANSFQTEAMLPELRVADQLSTNAVDRRRDVEPRQVTGEAHQTPSHSMFPQVHNQSGEGYANECASDDVA